MTFIEILLVICGLLWLCIWGLLVSIVIKAKS